MDRKHFRKLLKEKIILLDGATGTALQSAGMPAGVCPERWAAENPTALIDIQKAYVKAGTRILYTFTLGGNRLKLEEFNEGGSVRELNRRLAQVSRKAAGDHALVAGDLGPTGQFVEPTGDLTFEDTVNIYKEQVAGLLEGGVDLFVVETMIDVQETRAAILAVRETCDLPVMASVTFSDDGRTLMGSDPVTALISLQAAGADAVGCNCSTGPDRMIRFISEMKPYAKVPLFAKPNAGMPRLVDGKTRFDMDAATFAGFAPAFAEAGVNLFGGCCGTSPEYIEATASRIGKYKPQKPSPQVYSALTSSRKTVFTGHGEPVMIIGERINPTGKKLMQQALREQNTDFVYDMAAEQIQKGAQILDVNVGMPGIDEKTAMTELVKMLSGSFPVPLCIDSSDPDVIEAALRIYPGRALLNSVSAEKDKLRKLLPVAAKYGAMFVALPLDDEGVPATAKGRISKVETIFSAAQDYGFTAEDMVVDGLTMTVSSEPDAARETLAVLNWCTRKLGCGTVLGLSNVSFGLPERAFVNAAFFAMAVSNGLTMAIANPSAELLMSLKYASDVLMGLDEGAKNYLSRFSAAKKTVDTSATETSIPVGKRIFSAVVSGEREKITGLIQQGLQEGQKAQQMVNEYLIPAISRVGELYESKEYYLPQLIGSAETMKTGFEVLQPYLEESQSGSFQKPRVLMATVRGDIHDIGKNIVCLMLRNFGFDVLDLGKDVPAELIVNTVVRENIKLVGLSALMTTTMTEMKQVIALARSMGADCRFMVGGAVVTQEYADEIGADGYSADASSAVHLARKLLNVTE